MTSSLLAAAPAGLLSGLRASRRRRGFAGVLVAKLRRARARRMEQDIAEILASRGGAMRDRCERGSRQEPCRSFPFRRLPALTRR